MQRATNAYCSLMAKRCRIVWHGSRWPAKVVGTLLKRGRQVKPRRRDRWIASQGGATLGRGLYLVGLDVIGDFLTEINVTSPTCLREIESETSLDIAGQLLDGLPVRGTYS